MKAKSKFVVLPILILLAARFVFGIDGLYGQDSYEYLRFTNELTQYLFGGSHPYNFFWPILYPLFGSFLSLLKFGGAFSLQLVSVFSFIGTILTLRSILCLINKKSKHIDLYLSVLFFLSPFLLKASLVNMSDMLCVFFLTAHLLYIIKFRNDHSAKNLFMAIFLGMCAGFTRYGAFVLVAVTYSNMIIREFKSRRLIFIIPFLGAIILGITPHIIFTQGNFFDFMKHQWFTSWSVKNMLKNSFQTNDGYLNFTFPNIIFYIMSLFHPGHSIVFIPLAFSTIKNKIRVDHLFIFPVVIYLFFLSGIPTQNTRFILLLMPFMFLVMFPSFQLLFDKALFRKFLISFFIFLNVALFFLGFRKLYERITLEKDICEYLSKTYPNRIIYTFDIDVSLKGRNYCGEVFNLYLQQYYSFQTNSLVLYNEEKFQKQWHNTLVSKNWTNINNNCKLVKSKSFADGWTLYEIK